MGKNTIIELTKDYYPDKNENTYDNLFTQYNRVIIEALLTSFGLDLLLIKDQYGGDVDTVYNVRKIDTDSNMTYKNQRNMENYKNLEAYDSALYHKDKNFSDIKHEARVKFFEDFKPIKDEYTGNDIGFYGHSKGISPDKKAELDHIISASEVHHDRGRVLAGLDGKKLANSDENFAWTNKSLNASMQDKNIKEYVNSSDKINDFTKERMLEKDKEAREIYNRKINIAYYTSINFRKDVFNSAAKVGVRMGIRQALGFVLTEVVFAVMDEFKKIKVTKLKEILASVTKGIKKGFENAKLKYKEIIEKLKSGVLAGIIASLSTTLINTFFTTTKNIVRVIRQTWASLIEALKILFFNPNNLPFGERMRTVAKLIVTGASIIISIFIREFLDKSGLTLIPVIGETLGSFLEILSLGFISCSLLYFLDRNETVNKIVSVLNELPTLSNSLNYYKKQAKYFEIYAAQVLSIDIESFEKEINNFNFISKNLEKAKNEKEINVLLITFFKNMKIKIPWEGEFEEFMSNKNSTLIFE